MAAEAAEEGGHFGRQGSQSFPRKEKHLKQSQKQDVIAFRKSCPATGTGLSHYILMDKKAK